VPGRILDRLAAPERRFEDIVERFASRSARDG
jgi:hypothetical protein